MNVISDNKEILNATVSVGRINNISGLIIESRGGKKDTPTERNSDYQAALDLLLSRLKLKNINLIKVYLVSRFALKNWSVEEQKIFIQCSSKKEKNLKSKGGNPSKRILIEANLSNEEWLSIINRDTKIVLPIFEDEIEKNSSIFLNMNDEDFRQKVTRAIAIRQGQPKFRKKLMKAYNSCCAITGTNIPEILEAAHIIPYNGSQTNLVNNGILLRADYTLFLI